VHRIIKINQEIKELFVIYYNDKLEFYPDKCSTSELLEYVERFHIDLVNKQIIDINLNVKNWLSHVSQILDRGIIVTIDYGDIS